MKTLYKYIYNMEPNANPVFHVEKYLVKEDSDYENKEEMTGWEEAYYMFVDKDDGIDKNAVDNWEYIGYESKINGKHFWSFKNDKETMLKFQTLMKESELNNLLSYLERVEHIKARLESIIKCMNKED